MSDTLEFQELEDKLWKIVTNKEVISQLKAENKTLIREVEDSLEKHGITSHVFILPEVNRSITVTLSKKVKQLLDKRTLAEQLGVDKAELDVLGISRLTKEGVVSPEIIEQNINKVPETKVKIKAKKIKKNKKKDEGEI